MTRSNVFARLRQMIRRRVSKGAVFSSVKVVDSMADVPEKLGTVIYVIGTEKKYKWVVFNCPCDCGERLDVNLMRSRYPFWSLKLEDGRASLSPSVWVPTDRCGSHFWLVDSQVHWFRKKQSKRYGKNGFKD
jgi:hypothetical protein